MSVVRPPRSLLRDAALVRIREAIVVGELPAGGVVKDADLAGRLGLSVAPVRTALARLVEEGLVESKPQSHTRVTPVRPSVVRDAALVVRSMHELVVTTAAARTTEADVAAMATHNAAFAAAAASGDLDGAVAADDALHHVLVERCANAAAAATIARFTPMVRRLERLRFAAAHGAGSTALHEQLIAACAARDVPAAVIVTTEIWTALLSDLEEHP